MKRTKIDNKGFSLVELIIVIAIMAILAAALAPQLMKYIERSRKSTDSSTCASIKNTVNAAITEEEGYKEIKAAGNSIVFAFETAADLSVPSCPNLTASLKASLSDLAAPKASDAKKYQVTITKDPTASGGGADGLKVEVIPVNASGASN